MRIAIVTNYLPPRAGGLEGVVDAVALGYMDLGDDVSVIGFDDRSHEAHYRRVALGGWNGLERRGVPVPILTPTAIRELIREVRAADAVHIQGLAFLSTYIALLAARRRQKVVVTEHVGVISYSSPRFVAATAPRVHPRLPTRPNSRCGGNCFERARHSPSHRSSEARSNGKGPERRRHQTFRAVLIGTARIRTALREAGIALSF